MLSLLRRFVTYSKCNADAWGSLEFAHFAQDAKAAIGNPQANAETLEPSCKFKSGETLMHMNSHLQFVDFVEAAKCPLSWLCKIRIFLPTF